MCLNFMANSFVFGHKLVIMRPELFYKPCKAKTSEMHLNFTANSYVFGHTNCENAPRTFSVKPAGRELLKCI